MSDASFYFFTFILRPCTFRAPWQGAAIMQGYTPIQLVAPSAVSTAVIIDANICSANLKVSFFPMLIKLKIKN